MLSKKTQYALYALINLAKKYNTGPVFIGDIAREEKIPKKFLESILLDLKKIGVVNSKKGKGGGYYLVTPANEIDIAFVTRNFNGALGLLPCASVLSYEKCARCDDENKCGMRKVFRDLRDLTSDYLQNITVQDVIDTEDLLYGR